MTNTKRPKPLGPPKAKPRAVPAPKPQPPGVRVRKPAPKPVTAKPPPSNKPAPLPAIRPEQLVPPKPYTPAVGDVVELKSGGPRMTVKRFESEAHASPIVCTWYVLDDAHCWRVEHFKASLLRQITDKPEDTPERERCANIVRALCDRCRAGGTNIGLIELREALKAIEGGL